MAFNSAGLGLVHAMAHQPGATHNLPHGVCNAILLPQVCAFNAERCPERFRDIAQVMGGDITGLTNEQGAELAITLIRNLSKRVDIPTGFKALGISKDDCHNWIDKVLADPCLGGNPRQPTPKEIEDLYLACL